MLYTKNLTIISEFVTLLKLLLTYVPVAQLDRASASGAEGRAFESPQARLYSARLGNPFLIGSIT